MVLEALSTATFIVLVAIFLGIIGCAIAAAVGAIGLLVGAILDWRYRRKANRR